MPEKRSSTDAMMETITRVQTAYTEFLMRLPNVVGVGVGLRKRGGVFTQEPVLVVLVTHKCALEDLSETDCVPPEIDGVPVDVQVIGHPHADSAH